MIQEINNNELLIIKNYFIDDGQLKRGGIVVECGAAQGHYNPSLFLENELGWKFIGIEPNPEYWEILNTNRPSPHALKINMALSNVNGITQFNVAGSNSSLNHSEEHKIELGNRTFPEFNVNTITWKTFIKEYKIPFVDLLILDVEGCELMVLDGMKECEVLPLIMMIEYPRSNYDFILKNETTKEDFSGFKIIRDKLVEMGYMFDYVQNANAMFSKKEFWKNKIRPDYWYGEDNTYTLTGFMRYDKEKCKNL